MKGIRIFLADGFEDVEALGVCDVLRRGGLKVELTAISDTPTVRSSHGVTVVPDTYLSDLEACERGTNASDVMIFPGGMPGSKSLADSVVLMAMMRAHYAAGGTVAAICAAPGLVLSQLDGLEGVEFTCFDGFEDYLKAQGAKFRPEPAVVSGRIITGRSAGHALSFGLAILKALKGEAVAAEVAHSLYLG